MIYLDNAATTFPKPRSVIRETAKCLKYYCANSGRSSHKLAIKTTEEIYSTREILAKLVNFDKPENICFTSNATYALNMAIKGTLPRDSHILTSDLEHNSVIRPLEKLKKTLGIEISKFSTDGNVSKNIEDAITNKTFAIVSTLMSNVTGKEIQLSCLAEVASKHKLLLIADASQLIGHKGIDIRCIDRGVLCAPAHKGLFGIQGCGFAIFKDVIPHATVTEGGSGSESRSIVMPENLPERMEAGTLPAPSIVSLRAGIEFINDYTLEALDEKIAFLTECFTQRLQDINGLELVSAQNGILSFRMNQKSVSEIASYLDSFNIYVRDGLHCAPSAHEKLGTLSTGLIRISLSVLNDTRDADAVWKKLKNMN